MPNQAPSLALQLLIVSRLIRWFGANGTHLIYSVLVATALPLGLRGQTPGSEPGEPADTIPRLYEIPEVVVEATGSEGEGQPLTVVQRLSRTPGLEFLLAVPVNAPWAAVKETIEFSRAVGASTVVPIHDHLLADDGRALYLRLLGSLGGTDGGQVDVRDIQGAGPVDL